MSEMKEVTLYTDGGCEPNPGAGGYGVVLLYGKARKEVSGGFRLTTNNRMEIYAAITGLELLKEPCRVHLFSDSQYLVDAMTKGWVVNWKRRNWWRNNKEPALNIDLWERMLVLCEKYQVTFQWIKGHAGNLENERCDQLSYAALAQGDLPMDEGYENKVEPPEKSKLSEAGQPCRKCGTPVVKLLSRKLHSYLSCPHCQADYTLEDRVVVENLSLFDAAGKQV